MTTEQNALDLPALVRRRDYRRFLAIQLAPRARRGMLYALTAFADEMAHIPNHVNEPLAGFMRYAWWREALEAMQAGAPPRAHPLLQELAPWLRGHPSAYEALYGIIETGQHLLEEENDAEQQHRARDAWLDRLWRLQLEGEEAPLEVLKSLPLHQRIGPLAIWRVLLHGLTT